MIRAANVLLIAALSIAAGLAPAQRAPSAPTDAAYTASFGAVTVPALITGASAIAEVTVTNAGSASWSSDATTGPVYLAYHWFARDGSVAVWDGRRTPLGATLTPGQTRTIAATLSTPSVAGTYVLAFDLVREGIAWFGSPVRFEAIVTTASDGVAYVAAAGASATPDAHVLLPTTLVNVGTTTWSSAGSVFVSYHVYDVAGRLIVWDGIRSSVGPDVAPGQSRLVRVDVVAPHMPGAYTVRVDLVREGVAWFSSRGWATSPAPLRVQSSLASTYDSIDMPGGGAIGATLRGTLTLTNTGATRWSAAGPSPVALAYHVYAPESIVVWDGVRSALPRDVGPGESVVVNAALRLPNVAGRYTVQWDLVQEAVAWFSGLGTAPLQQSVSALPASLVGGEWSRIPTVRPIVALTFDCGSNNAAVGAILSTLAAADVPATFFLTGRWAETYPASAMTIASRYPVGAHTYSHPHLGQLSDADVTNEIAGGAAALARVTGHDPHPLFRFPYGESDARTVAIANALGYGGIRWTVDTLGWQGASAGQSAGTVIARVLASLAPGEIVLMHVGSADDGTTLDADALASLIGAIRARGYELVTLRDVLW